MKKPIGIFDSGVGGLTVYKTIRNHFVEEDLVYFGDTARVPYGPKSPNTIIDYSIQNSRFLLQQGIKILVVACNTSSAYALDKIKELTGIPIIGVIDPGAEQAALYTKSKRIGIIGTEATVRSGAYSQAITKLIPDAVVYSKACPLFVPIVEEGWQDGDITKSIAKHYLSYFEDKDIDTLVLGCTHYPLLKQTIQETVGEKIRLVDSADAIASYLKRLIPEETDGAKGTDSFFVSDNEAKFLQISQNILESPIMSLKRVRLFESWFTDEI
ncbi:MAG: glutamate racemase [Candidatus Cloacimonetes bacterium HGW-Cloacimonetes-2]|jgi:glutamate racemase|nr:MAG: glutamate racemase [Candidatus Cloacimonetes bacterium HGW-Cloacimonetes-2]